MFIYSFLSKLFTRKLKQIYFPFWIVDSGVRTGYVFVLSGQKDVLGVYVKKEEESKYFQSSQEVQEDLKKILSLVKKETDLDNVYDEMMSDQDMKKIMALAHNK